jgi:hypothetical protein
METGERETGEREKINFAISLFPVFHLPFLILSNGNFNFNQKTYICQEIR